MHKEDPMVEIKMKEGGVIRLELYPEYAPKTVANFEKLVKKGFYDGLTFHRVISGFMIQGGDPEGTGMGGAKENIKGEFAQNGVKNDLKHTRGVISMARSMLTEISKNTWKKINTISSAENSPVSLPIRKN